MKEPSTKRARQITLWTFVRGDLGPRDFERWACEEQGLESDLGTALYLDVISADYRDVVANRAISVRLEAYLRSLETHVCECSSLADLAVVDMGEHEQVFATWVEVASRGEPYWWLWAAQCRACTQGWLVGSEERQNDVYCMRRLSRTELTDLVQNGKWPPDFDHYETLLELGRKAGRSVDFVDPLGSSTLQATMTDVARDRPGVALSTLAALLNLDCEIAEQIARRAMAQAGVVIDLSA